MNKSPPFHIEQKILYLHNDLYPQMRTLILLASILICCFNAQAQFQDGLDPTFGTKGIATNGSAIMYDDWGISDAVLQPDGKIVAIAGYKIVRYNNDGTIDNSFGKSGIFNDTLRDDNDTPLVWFNSYALSSLVLQTDGKIIVVGTADVVLPSRQITVLMFRLKTNGVMDSTFGKNGMVCNNILGTNRANGIVLRPDGKIIVLGEENYDYFQMLVRYLPNGAIDSSFGINGKVVNTLASMSGQGDIELMSDGRILTLCGDYNAARYLSNGSLDTTYNHTGIGSVFPSASFAPYGTAMALCPDGKVWIAGYPLSHEPTPFMVGRINMDGSVDTSFMHVGYTQYNWDTSWNKRGYNKCLDILLQPDNKLILGGKVMHPITGRDNFALLRIKPDGLIDSSFGDNGRLLTQIKTDTAIDLGGYLNKLILQPDNKLLALGVSSNKTEYGALATIVRYNADGKTAIDEIPKPYQGTVSIYPNPAYSLLSIRNTTTSKITSICIYNMQGALQKWIYKPTGNEINISELPNACYIIVISTENTQYKNTLIIQH